MTVQDQVEFFKTEKLCFGCLRTGHHSKGYENRVSSEICRKNHPTCLHNDKFKEQKPIPLKSDSNLKEKQTVKETQPSATANRDVREAAGFQTSYIVPVWVSSITA